MPRSTQNTDSHGIRLNKYLAQAGVASRRYADVLIERGKVRVNGKTVREMGTLVEPGDKVDVSGTPVQPQTETVYLVLHKPAGVVTTMRDPQPAYHAPKCCRRPASFPSGWTRNERRFLLTNDGALANRLLHRGMASRRPIARRSKLSRERQGLNEGVVHEFEAAGAKVRVVAVGAAPSSITIRSQSSGSQNVRASGVGAYHPYALPVRRAGRFGRRAGPPALGEGLAASGATGGGMDQRRGTRGCMVESTHRGLTICPLNCAYPPRGTPIAPSSV